MRTWLKEIICNKGFTQEQLANVVDLHPTSVNKYILGERRPSVDAAKKIASVLDFDWQLFYPDNEEDFEGDTGKRVREEELT